MNDTEILDKQKLRQSAYWALVSLLFVLCIHAWTGFFPIKILSFLLNLIVLEYIWSRLKGRLF